MTLFAPPKHLASQNPTFAATSTQGAPHRGRARRECPPLRWTILALTIGCILSTSDACGDCGESFVCCPNVGWVAADSVAACPAGDSLRFAHPAQHPHPSKLRMTVYYTDSDCNPRSGVPAESIYVVTAGFTGNLQLNGHPGVIFADAPTNAGGLTRFTVSGFAGAGSFTVTLYVSGVGQGTKTIRVRTVDGNSSWVVGNPEDSVAIGANSIDVSYAGGVDSTDYRLIRNHADHSAQVIWSVSDRVSTCPAGDSVYAGRPARLRVPVTYLNASGAARSDVRPESLWVVTSTAIGNVVANDEADVTHAADSTDATGHAFVELPSLSGCGILKVDLYVSGVLSGSRGVFVRSTDANADADGRVESGDAASPCDLDYQSAVTQADRDTAARHEEHWRRQALHGALVKRTVNSIHEIGYSPVTWSPSGKYLAYSQFNDEYECRIWFVPSDPPDDTPIRVTNVEYGHDYTPFWSPLNDEILFDRNDKEVRAKQVPWFGNSERVVTTSNNCSTGDLMPAVSSDGLWVAFSRCNSVGGYSIWKVAINGGDAVQLTPSVAANTDFYPSWSPNGAWVLFQRQPADGYHKIYRVPADSGAVEEVFVPPTGYDAVQPAYSPDSRVVLVGHGGRSYVTRQVVTSVLDPLLAPLTQQEVVANYSDPTFAEIGSFPILSPVMSPDGTRLALKSTSVWAARRNMNLPPALTYLGPIALQDTTTLVSVTVNVSVDTTLALAATDPESDPITYGAHYIDDSWMEFDPETGELNLTPGAQQDGEVYFVKLYASTPSGGVDAVIAQIFVCPGGGCSLGPSASRPVGPEEDRAGSAGIRLGPNPGHGGFAILTDRTVGGIAQLEVYDLAGRHWATIRRPSGERLQWDGKDGSGVVAGPGVYLYRLVMGSQTQQGKFVVLR